MSRVSEDSRNLCEDDQTCERRGRDKEAGNGGVSEHVVQSLPELVTAGHAGYDGGDGRPAHPQGAEYHRRRHLLTGHGLGVVPTVADKCEFIIHYHSHIISYLWA